MPITTLAAVVTLAPAANPEAWFRRLPSSVPNIDFCPIVSHAGRTIQQRQAKGYAEFPDPFDPHDAFVGWVYLPARGRCKILGGRPEVSARSGLTGIHCDFSGEGEMTWAT